MSLRSKRRNARNGIEYRRRGTAPIPTIYVPNMAKHGHSRSWSVAKARGETFIGPISIAQAWGNDAPGGDMQAMRSRWLRWEQRKVKQREKAAA